MAQSIQRTPTAYTPEKYPIPVSQATGYYGEYPGYEFDPWQGEYFPDKEQRQAYYESTGLAEKTPKKPGMLEQYVVPAAATAGTYALGQAAASYLTGGAAGAGTAGTAGTGAGMLGGSTAGAGAGSTAGTGAGMLAGETAGTTAGTAAAAPAAPAIVGAEAVGGGASGATGGGAAGTGAGALATGATVGALGAYAGWQGMEAYNKLKDEDTRSEGALQGYLLSNPATFWLAPFADKLGLKDNRWKDENKKLANLAKQDVYIPEPVIAGMPTHSRKKEEMQRTDLADDFVGFDPNGQWVNNKFNQSRDEKDLVAEDIVNFATFAERDHDWFKKPLQERLNVANQALQAGAVKEGRGTISVDWDKLGDQPAAAYQGLAGNPTLEREKSGGGASAANAAKGTRLSPGIYADGKGGTYRK